MKINVSQFATLVLSVFVLTLTTTAQNSPADDHHLNAKQKSMVAISSYTAQGKITELSLALNDGLDAGLTINEINEAIVQLYAYCGFPRSLNGINAFRKVLEERNARGISDEQGKEITMHSQSGDRYERGRKVLEELTNMPQSKPAPGFGEFSPRIDAFLKEHLFADIFESDVLSYFQRELITNATLASTTGTGSQLGAHIMFGMNVGISEGQLNDMFDVIEKTVGKEEAENGRAILKNVLTMRNQN
ncbi:carboxymuconolactone decarboxylase family protein [Draconibacterium sp. IB214405]|uniref:carboxymuconolactone decarboxylase family protein n=1 Tax=Draconibacterium sp. IB214405 TaxID=3097352 RepID=UPI002A0ABF5C|nr:carboxymuconolactone decarboxylase family protein [Draconibacterium sp. IB214405]MDX8339425.1 carboxymuconolactone decarboxylase family protein [Draconibacterium sp. IB214405]